MPATADARPLQLLAPVAPPVEQLDVEALVDSAIERLDDLQLSRDYWRREELTVQHAWMPSGLVAAMRDEVRGMRQDVVRKRLFNYKISGSISYYTVREFAPTIMALYKSPRFISFLSELSGQPLMTCPETDPHAAAVYCYERPADRVGCHYDNSWYHGARYTVLIGLEDDSDARLTCHVHKADPFRETEVIDVATRPGTTVIFNGNKLWHGVSPIGPNQTRIVLSLQYVTDRRMTPIKRVINNFKDALTYFGVGMYFRRNKGTKGLPSRP